jgi:hypothetical protein
LLRIVIIFNETLTNPKSTASRLLGLNLNSITVMQAGIFVSICSTILTYLFLNLIASNISNGAVGANEVLTEVLKYIASIQPIYFAANQIFQMLLFAAIMTLGGRIFNGKGTFFNALLCVTSVELILLLLKVVQLVLLPISMLLSFAVIIPGVIWSLWAFASMAAFIHGFKSTFLTFCGGFAFSFFILIFLRLFY